MSIFQPPLPVTEELNRIDPCPMDLSARCLQPSLPVCPEPRRISSTEPSSSEDKPHIPPPETVFDANPPDPASNLEMVEFDGRKFYLCKICNARLTSIISLKQHEAGKKHQAAVISLKRKAPSTAISPASSFDEDNVTSTNPRQSPVPNFLKDRSNVMDILGLDHSTYMDCNPKRQLLPPSRLKLRPTKRCNASVKMDDYSKLRRSTDESSEDSENRMPAAFDQEISTFPLETVNTGLRIRDVLKRVCLTQIISLLSNRADASFGVPKSSSGEQVLLHTLNTLCTSALSNQSPADVERERVEPPSSDTTHLARNFLLLSWCQQLAMLDG